MQVKGTIRYMEVSMGFWGLEGADGSRWELFDLPESYKKNGLTCILDLIVMDGETINMWGRPAKVKAVID